MKLGGDVKGYELFKNLKSKTSTKWLLRWLNIDNIVFQNGKQESILYNHNILVLMTLTTYVATLITTV